VTADANKAARIYPTRGADLTKVQIAQCIDVEVAAAGTTSAGIMQAAKHRGVPAIDLDSNQKRLLSHNQVRASRVDFFYIWPCKRPVTICKSLIYKEQPLMVYMLLNSIRVCQCCAPHT
jgi:hypothetical protein